MQAQDIGAIKVVDKADPCPFCGNVDLVFVVMTISYTWPCKCTNCGASGPIGSTDPDNAYKKWNERHVASMKER